MINEKMFKSKKLVVIIVGVVILAIISAICLSVFVLNKEECYAESGAIISSDRRANNDGLSIFP